PWPGPRPAPRRPFGHTRSVRTEGTTGRSGPTRSASWLWLLLGGTQPQPALASHQRIRRQDRFLARVRHEIICSGIDVLTMVPAPASGNLVGDGHADALRIDQHGSEAKRGR